MTNRFPILSWPIGDINEKTVSEVKLWVEAGLTANISPRFDPDCHEKELMIALLDECEKYGISLIVFDARTSWRIVSDGDEAYRASFKEAYADFGSHPATLGFFIGDEPMKADMQNVITATQIQLEEAPELLPFCNLLPIWPESKPPYMGYGDLESYVKEIKENLPGKIVSYDRYTQAWGTDVGKETYFHDMRIYRDIAVSKGLPLWTCLLSVAHWAYQTPDEDHFKWQLNTALAGGCNGIIWFTLNEPDESSYRNAPIDKFGEKSLAFYYLSRVCREFHASTSDIFKDLTLDNCYHVGKAWGGWDKFEPGVSDVLLDVKTFSVLGNNDYSNAEMIVSFFTHKSGDKYLAVVNNSPTVNDLNFCLTFNKNNCDPYEIRTFGHEKRVFSSYSNRVDMNFDPNRIDTTVNPKEKCFSVNLWASAGQMYLFRL
jgi:hypothetical protein